MKKLLFICYLLSILLIKPANAQSHKYDLWKKPSFFRGFNIMPVASHQLKDYRDLKAAGATLAQLGIDGFDYVDPPYDLNIEAIEKTDRMVKFCDSAGIYYTLTVRSGPGRRDVYLETEEGYPKSTIWKNKTEQIKYAQMIKEIVSRYKDDTLFIGIGPIVEPNPLFNVISINAQMLKANLEKDSIDFKAVNQTCIDEIRKVDEKIPIIVQNFQYSCPEFFAITDTYTDEYIVYEFHSYRPVGYVKNEKPNSVSYPDTYLSINDLALKYFDKQFFIENVFKYVDSVQKETGKPVFLGEFGLLYEQIGGTRFLDDMYDICIEKGWHFALWIYRGGGSDGGMDYEKKSPKYWETVLNMLKGNSDVGEELNSEINFLKIYPNPANDYLYVILSNKFITNKIFIYSMQGELLKTFDSNGEETQKIFTVDLNSGIYFVKIANEFKRFIIIR